MRIKAHGQIIHCVWWWAFSTRYIDARTTLLWMSRRMTSGISGNEQLVKLAFTGTPRRWRHLCAGVSSLSGPTSLNVQGTRWTCPGKKAAPPSPCITSSAIASKDQLLGWDLLTMRRLKELSEDGHLSVFETALSFYQGGAWCVHKMKRTVI